MDDTGDLLSKLNDASDINKLDKYISAIDGNYDLSFSRYLNDLMTKMDVLPAALIERSNIEHSYCYQILNGRKNPGRDKILAISLALQLDLNETQRLLKLAGEGALYPKSKRDSLIIYALEHKMSVIDTGILLDKYGEKSL